MNSSPPPAQPPRPDRSQPVAAVPATLPRLWPSWRLHCRQAAGLLLQDQDQPLRWSARLRLRLHLVACEACTRFAGQLELMQGALKGWAHYRDQDPDG